MSWSKTASCFRIIERKTVNPRNKLIKCMMHAWLSISNCTEHHRRTKYVLTYHFSVGQYFFQIYDLWNILDILSVLPSQIKKNPSSKGCTPLNSEEFMHRAVYHKVCKTKI